MFSNTLHRSAKTAATVFALALVASCASVTEVCEGKGDQRTCSPQKTLYGRYMDATRGVEQTDGRVKFCRTDRIGIRKNECYVETPY